ncbi:hypothetical protein FBZ84_10443 [Azospirillum baldaniorum]|uniref:hypothetical protein n=1 Tax=Azospirillum baldaniorum TaxID=1064539 RepID=UPI0011AD09B7|nr:hypothetical protein [Azospirillum baldaniorum]TWA68398.1 hypothetical protein FBZ84_10443 [Azospirillum baldaniorum]
MGVFDAMTTVVLEAGRLDREEERRPMTVTVAAPSPWRFRLPRMPALPALFLAVLFIG